MNAPGPATSLLAAGFALLVALSIMTAIRVARAQEAPEPEPFPVAVDHPAKLLTRVAVVYSVAARRDGIAGTVVVSARVGRDGRVRETRIASSIPELDEFAASAVSRYEFSPAHDDVGEVESWVLVPVRFDESLPTGTRGGERVDARGYSDVDRAFESDVDSLKQSAISPPGAADLELRRRIMVASLQLEVIPAPGAGAMQAFHRGDTLGRSMPATRDQRKAAWAEAAWLAPWWPLPYRRLASIAIAERDFVAADACAQAILAGRASDPEAQAMLKRIGQLKRAVAVNRPPRK